jgi:hypothetical protein
MNTNQFSHIFCLLDEHQLFRLKTFIHHVCYELSMEVIVQLLT